MLPKGELSFYGLLVPRRLTSQRAANGHLDLHRKPIGQAVLSTSASRREYPFKTHAVLVNQEQPMFKGLTAIASLAVILTVASPVLAQSPGWVKVGGLNCTMSPTIGLLVVEEQAVNCRFTPDGYYPPEHYIGTIGTVGIAIGVVGGGMLAWAVYMPTQGPSQGSLAGTYGGASGDIDVGVGVGANALWVVQRVRLRCNRSRSKVQLAST
jgi:hypothetical protein